MARVLVLNKGPHDYSDAELYGDLVFCTTGSLKRDDIAQMYREMEPCIETSGPDDYILLTSLSSLCSVACAMFACKHGRLNLLIYDNGAYINRSITLDDNATTHKRHQILR